jgi:hypothetical protein
MAQSTQIRLALSASKVHHIGRPHESPASLPENLPEIAKMNKMRPDDPFIVYALLRLNCLGVRLSLNRTN